jgi:hypothetical protein
MKLKVKTLKGFGCCGNQEVFQLDGWDKTDWLCADCMLNELKSYYDIIPNNLR